MKNGILQANSPITWKDEGSPAELVSCCGQRMKIKGSVAFCLKCKRRLRHKKGKVYQPPYCGQ